ncbi:MAG: hypothetical protein HOK20_03500 [Alphaproteobacteria bacterium]|nr:hypothetical protein [Alphaproteobacteria bacterium]
MDHSHAVRSPFVDKYNSTNGDDQERLAETLKRFSHHGESFVRAKLKQGGVALPASPVKSVRRSTESEREDWSDTRTKLFSQGQNWATDTKDDLMERLPDYVTRRNVLSFLIVLFSATAVDYSYFGRLSSLFGFFLSFFSHQKG